MIDNNKARVVEYNVRLGDPETQPLMMRLDSDLLTLLDHAVDSTLEAAEAQWLPGSAIGIVLAAGEYPAGGSQGKPISGLDDTNTKECKVFHAGTKLEDGRIVTAGGRVLCATATGNTLAEAKQIAEVAASKIHWDGYRYRRDIGYRAINRS